MCAQDTLRRKEVYYYQFKERLTAADNSFIQTAIFDRKFIG